MRRQGTGPGVGTGGAGLLATLRAHQKIVTLSAIVVFMFLVLSMTSPSKPSTGAESHVRGAEPLPVVLSEPHGGTLVDVMASQARKDELRTELSPSMLTLTLSPRQLCDIEMILNGGFSPLTSFMSQATYESVLANNRLDDKFDNAVWTMPITLDVSSSFADTVNIGDQLALRDSFFNLVAVITVEEKYIPDKSAEASAVFGTTDTSHPGVDYLMHTAGPVYLAGPLEGVALPMHFDFPEVRKTPAEVRAMITKLGWHHTVAFQTRNPMHRAHIELTRLAAAEVDAGVLIHPVVGMTKPGDVDYAVRVRCYKAIVASGSYYKPNGVRLSLLPIAMRMAGPREAVWHALIRKNYGATHFVIGRDHAGCKSSEGKDFYGPYDAQQLAASFSSELGINILPFKKLAYVPSLDKYLPAEQVPQGAETLSISGTKFRAMMAAGAPIPQWFSHPDVIKILQEVSPPLSRRGFVVFFTGLSGSGKTTITNALIQTLSSIMPTRGLTVMDGDVVRTHLSSNLGFSIEDRNKNVARMGWVASEVVRHRGVAVCSTISPFERSRVASRDYVTSSGGGFILVHISTPASVCAQRDVKGLYAKAKAGSIKLTGVSHPYENPEKVELTIDASVTPVQESVKLIMAYLVKRGYVSVDSYPLPGLPDTVLEPAHVVTADVKDPTERLCRADDPRVVVLTGLPGSGIENLYKAAKSVCPVGIHTASAKHVVSGENDVLGTSLGETGESDDPFMDPTLSSGTPLTTRLNGDQITELAFTLWDPLRKLSDSPVGVVMPRVLPYLQTMLRIDPCLRVVVSKPSELDAVVDSLRRLTDDASATSRQAPQLVQEFYAAIETLAAGHPRRVRLVVDGDTEKAQPLFQEFLAGCSRSL